MFIQDSIHGYIELGELEEELISTAQFQRLRRLKQLGFTSLVYPSTTHTRFEHSIGVMNLAGRFAEHLDIDQGDKDSLKVAALLHDIGHGPYSHTSELVMKRNGITHEEFSCRKIESEGISSILEDHDIDPERIQNLIKGKGRLGQIIAGDIDVDRMDYLMRDSYYSGVAHGTIDASTIIRASKIHDGEVVFRSKFKQSVEGVLTARHFMIPTLYEHNAVKRSEKMMERSIQELVEKGDIEAEDLAEMDDIDIKAELRDSERDRPRYLNRRLDNRNIFKTALRWDKSKVTKKGLRQLSNSIESEVNLEERIAEEAGVKSRDVILNKPKIPKKEDANIKMLKGGEIVDLGDISPLTQAINRSKWENTSIEVYTPEEHIKDVQDAAQDILSQHKGILKNFL